jgi:hypothetical protein
VALTGSDIARNADLFRLAYPNWPHAEPAAGRPEITATSPDRLDPEAEQMAREERWT